MSLPLFTSNSLLYFLAYFLLTILAYLIAKHSNYSLVAPLIDGFSIVICIRCLR
jgi:hypothetical protein